MADSNQANILALFQRNHGAKAEVARLCNPEVSKQMVDDVLRGRRKSARVTAAIRAVASKLIEKEAKEQQEALSA